MFEQSTYSFIEGTGSALPVLIISNPPSFDITVQVTSTDISASGEYCSILINHCYHIGTTNILQEEVRIILLDHTLSDLLLEGWLLHSIF